MSLTLSQDDRRFTMSGVGVSICLWVDLAHLSWGEWSDITIVLCFNCETHLLQDQAPTRGSKSTGGRQAYPPCHSAL